VPLSVQDLAASYGGPIVLSGVSFDAEQGERIGVLGPNGGGKSTLFRVLLGELRPLRGSVRRPPRLGFVPQTERSRLDYPVSALDVALMGTLSRVPWWRPVGRRERRAALGALERVGLADLADEQFGELSGGQRQRVLVARALVQDAPVLLLDEPFSGVDQTSADLLERLLGDLAGEDRAVLVATHDLE
jgi:ABC-type Mn2+/Zn2+ transport system ATPase subunit